MFKSTREAHSDILFNPNLEVVQERIHSRGGRSSFTENLYVNGKLVHVMIVRAGYTEFLSVAKIEVA